MAHGDVLEHVREVGGVLEPGRVVVGVHDGDGDGAGAEAAALVDGVDGEDEGGLVAEAEGLRQADDALAAVGGRGDGEAVAAVAAGDLVPGERCSFLNNRS